MAKWAATKLFWAVPPAVLVPPKCPGTRLSTKNDRNQQNIKDELFCAMDASLKAYLGKNSHLVRKP